jgi:hypothetical protein
MGEGGIWMAKLARNMRRDREAMFTVIARSEATTASAVALRAKAEAIHSFFELLDGLLRFARNDGI